MFKAVKVSATPVILAASDNGAVDGVHEAVSGVVVATDILSIRPIVLRVASLYTIGAWSSEDHSAAWSLWRDRVPGLVEAEQRPRRCDSLSRAVYNHPNKPARWIVNRHFGKFDKFRNDRWVFGDPDTSAYLPKFAWTNIVRHTLVLGRASPMTPHWPSTGPGGARGSNLRWIGIRAPGRTRAVRSAETTC
ncbi:hypothetical protein [Nonomuraea sp. NPDC049400]|uniref:hypothetical protein n=1 Tax=Nonomuraea sp. NPDC049400 TaxID=3364352 RepID=UPI0037A1F4C6